MTWRKPRPEKPRPRDFRLSSTSERILEMALREGLSLGSMTTEPEHILKAFERDGRLRVNVTLGFNGDDT